MTAKEYMDEVMLRLRRMDVSLNLSTPQIMTYVNRGREQVQKATLALYPERYGKIVTINLPQSYYGTAEVLQSYAGHSIKIVSATLPIDFIEASVVILQWITNLDYVNPGITYRTEARRMTEREMYTVEMNAWNVPSIWRPAYTIVRNANTLVWSIRLAGVDIDSSTNLYDIGSNVRLEMWYTAALTDLEEVREDNLTDTEVTIPPQVDELVIYYAMMYCLQNISKYQVAQSVAGEIQRIEGMLIPGYELQKQKEEIMLPSKEGI